MTIRVSDLAKKVSAALNGDERTAKYGIEVIDQHGLVTLKGTVPSEEVVRAAVEIAGEQEGVVDVVDALEVDETSFAEEIASSTGAMIAKKHNVS
jgi:osmotically-inducible protein OsmY